eukprot:INCI8950.1.p1 GENE.INCI8950.1~~INCI8950.1.p1  ORF type:complete len:571 (-),score=71.91 INCI8950.1:3318-5030(-)
MIGSPAQDRPSSITESPEVANWEARMDRRSRAGASVPSDSSVESGFSTVAAAAARAARGTSPSLTLAETPANAPDIGEAITYRTHGSHRKGKFRWVIDKYSLLPQKPKKRTFTDKFPLCGHMWKLSVTPGGEKSSSREPFMSIYLWYQGTDEVETSATIQLVDLNGNGPFKVEHSMTRVMAPYDDDRNGVSKARGWAEFAPVSYIEQCAKDDRIVLELELQVKGEAKHTLQRKTDFCDFERPADDSSDRLLRRDFGKLLASGSFSDVVFEVEGEDFPAHKAIVSARSPVLGAMFAHDTVEVASGKVTVTGVQAGIFDEVIHYIYCGRCSFEHLELLLAVADRFCLVDLAEQCAVRLLASVTVDNVCDRLVLAHDHSAERLRKGCLAFINANAESVLNSVGYCRLRQARPDLPATILESIYCDESSPLLLEPCGYTSNSNNDSDCSSSGGGGGSGGDDGSSATTAASPAVSGRSCHKKSKLESIGPSSKRQRSSRRGRRLLSGLPPLFSTEGEYRSDSAGSSSDEDNGETSVPHTAVVSATQLPIGANTGTGSAGPAAEAERRIEGEAESS